ncbi:MAG TPA: MarR family transcriptional regulator [Sphingobium sp.]|uniref:MarR family winged helix-turn-helix transcriptional regulator n=1 Tax=Sphingobium sp. TaxID=1912891 RepID=UPI002ECFD597
MSRCYCAQLRSAARKVGSVYDEALSPLGVNIAQYSLMRTIERRQPVSFTEVGRLAQLDRSTIGRNVRVLERKGLVDTGRGEDDQREAMVRLSPSGTRLLEAAGPLWEACQHAIEMRLGSGRMKALDDILHAL